MAMAKLKFNEKVTYDNGIFKGNGLVLGIATLDNPLMGCGYIIKDLSNNFPNKEYKYDTFIVYETHLNNDY